MKLRIPIALLVALVLFTALSLSSAHAQWQAGAASTIITPEQNLWMAGYGSRTVPAIGKRTELYAKALVLDDGAGNRGAIITLDLVGIDRKFSRKLCHRLATDHRLLRKQIAICTSHTHSGPVVGTNLGPLHYWILDDKQRSLIDAYNEDLLEKIVTVTGDAIAQLAPARLQSGNGKCTFAVNRRNNKPYDEVPDRRAAGNLLGPVDHDVPVLSVRDLDGNLTAILFGYACHATVLSLNEWNGDYPGYAQATLEQRFPGVTALFWAGCGGDQNPLPRQEIPLAKKYGTELARAVADVLKTPMPELGPALATRYREIAAPLDAPPTAEELAKTEKSANRFEVARARLLQRQMQAKGAIADRYPFPIGLWTLGNRNAIDFVFLGGEVVVDYALRLKNERHGTRTWVAAYTNDVMAYIPSLRVLKEGGYEGGTSNVYYGLPALWHNSIEETIISSVHELSAQKEPQADPVELPRIPPTEPADALQTFEVRPGFRIELAASEPLVTDPIDIEFDALGRMFVVEMRGYSERREDALGRIKLLVDDDQDGVFDRATIYAKDLKWPTSVCCYDGGVFVAATPDIYYFKDTDGDGVAELKETVFTGFGSQESRLNMQALVNSLQWGPDNRIWGSTARNGGLIRRPDQSKKEAIDLRGSDFSFDPGSLELRAENGTAQFGMSFDSKGGRYVCSNSNHIQWVGWERSWIGDNPYHRMPSPLVSIADDGAAAPVFRISPDEPWRIVRTRWRVSGVVKGAVEGGGRVSGYFTAATGITIYSSDAFGEEYRDTAFIGDAGSNLVHHKILRYDRLKAYQPVAERIAGEAKKQTEFLRSTDNWFRPVNFANGPDRCLYICDMYREVIEHPWSLPEGIKHHLDLNSGNDRGRIWRVVPDGYQRSPFNLTDESGWHDRTNRRLAYESGSPEPPLVHPLPQNRAGPWGIAFALNALRTPKSMINQWTGRHSLKFRAALAEMIGKTGNLPSIRIVLDDIVTAGISSDSLELLTSLESGLRVARLTLAKADPDELRAGLLIDSLRLAADPNTDANFDPNRHRLAAAFLVFDSSDQATSALEAIVIDKNASPALRNTALGSLASRPGTPSFLTKNWKVLSPPLKTATITILTARRDSAQALLKACIAGNIPRESLTLNQTTLLLEHRDKQVAALAAKLFPQPETTDRAKVVKQYAKALMIKGDPARGKEVYKTVACITCHKSPNGEGFAVGPDLATFKTAGADSILTNLFNPNAEVAPQYQAFTFTFENGESLIGIIAAEDPKNVTLRMAGGLERSFPRRQVQAMKGLGQSLMPEGLEAALTEQDVADLLEFIKTAR